jgi:hypothetical protein
MTLPRTLTREGGRGERKPRRHEKDFRISPNSFSLRVLYSHHFRVLPSRQSQGGEWPRPPLSKLPSSSRPRARAKTLPWTSCSLLHGPVCFCCRCRSPHRAFIPQSENGRQIGSNNSEILGSRSRTGNQCSSAWLGFRTGWIERERISKSKTEVREAVNCVINRILGMWPEATTGVKTTFRQARLIGTWLRIASHPSGS